jgi:hypothetical protein
MDELRFKMRCCNSVSFFYLLACNIFLLPIALSTSFPAVFELSSMFLSSPSTFAALLFSHTSHGMFTDTFSLSSLLNGVKHRVLFV